MISKKMSMIFNYPQQSDWQGIPLQGWERFAPQYGSTSNVVQYLKCTEENKKLKLTSKLKVASVPIFHARSWIMSVGWNSLKRASREICKARVHLQPLPKSFSSQSFATCHHSPSYRVKFCHWSCHERERKRGWQRGGWCERCLRSPLTRSSQDGRGMANAAVFAVTPSSLEYDVVFPGASGWS